MAKKTVKHELPKPPTIKRARSMPKGLRNRPYDFVDAGKYRHRHMFVGEVEGEKWYVRRERRGNRWFLYEEAYCIYDGCGQKKVRHLKKPYCRHCGQLKEVKVR